MDLGKVHGYLHIETPVAGWVREYFVLNDNILWSFKSQAEANCTGDGAIEQIDIKGATVAVEIGVDDGWAFAIALASGKTRQRLPNDKVCLSADSVQQRADWLWNLHHAGTSVREGDGETTSLLKETLLVRGMSPQQVSKLIESRTTLDRKACQIFADEQVDGESFLQMQEEDLKEMNIKMGPRKKIMKLLSSLLSRARVHKPRRSITELSHPIVTRPRLRQGSLTRSSALELAGSQADIDLRNAIAEEGEEEGKEQDQDNEQQKQQVEGKTKKEKLDTRLLNDDELWEIATSMQNSIEVKDREYRNGLLWSTTYKQCFLGSDAVDWMLEQALVETREAAVQLGNKLMSAGAYSHVTQDHLLKDAKLFYRFNPRQDTYIEYHPLTADLVQSCAVCFSKIFVTAEVLTQAVRVTVDEFFPFALACCRLWSMEGLSWVATYNKEVIGFCLAEDSVQEEPTDPEIIALAQDLESKMPAKIVPIFQMLDDLTAKLKEQWKTIKGEEMVKNECLHVIASGVNPVVAGNNISAALTARVLGNASKKYDPTTGKAFNSYKVEATGFASQHLTRKFNPDNPIVYELDYQEWKFDGEAIFAGAQVPKCLGMIIELPAEGTFEYDFLCASMYATTHRAVLPSDNSYLLDMYALFMQAKNGSCKTKQPSVTQVTKRVQWNAWNKLGNLDSKVAMKRFIELIDKGDAKWRTRLWEDKIPFNSKKKKEGDLGFDPRRALWIPDKQSKSCLRCQKSFGLFRRRHHCRRCGCVVCDDCSLGRIPLPDLGYQKPVRVCSECE